MYLIIEEYNFEQKNMRPHRNLVTWQESMQFVVDIYLLTKSLPKEEKFGLVSQMRRASVSIAANIAEGATCISDKEKLRFFNMADGSASEMDTFLELCRLLQLIPEDECQRANKKLERVSALLAGLRKSKEKRMGKRND